MLRCRSIAALSGILWLGACGATSPPPEGVRFRSENFFRVIENGFVVAPVGGDKLVTDPDEATAFFAGRFYAALTGALPGTPITSPETTRYLHNREGEAAHSRFQALQLQLVEGDSLQDAALAAVAEDIQQRYILVSWMSEEIVEAIQETSYDDYGSVRNSEDVRRFAYQEVKGRADRKSTRLNSSHTDISRMPSSA